MRFSSLVFFSPCLAVLGVLTFFAGSALASPTKAHSGIPVLSCKTSNQPQGIVRIEIFGDPETWPKLASGAGVTALGSAEEYDAQGKDYHGEGVYFSDTAGINFTVDMVADTRANFDFQIGEKHQSLHVINRWNGVFKDFDMVCDGK